MRRGRSATPTTYLHPLTVQSDYQRAEATFVQGGDLSGIQRYIIPTTVLDVTREHLVSHGASDAEAALCWAGTRDAEAAIVTTALVFTTSSGLATVHVSSAETALLYAHCHARGLTLFAQVHSHPRAAFHSPVDELSPHSAEPGFLSLVVPNFGSCPFDSFESWAAFEQVAYEDWREWSTTEKQHRLRILDAIIRIP